MTDGFQGVYSVINASTPVEVDSYLFPRKLLLVEEESPRPCKKGERSGCEIGYECGERNQLTTKAL